MSHLLWKYYWENDVDRFRRLLAPAGPNAHAAVKGPAAGPGGGLGGGPGGGASPGGPGTSPRNAHKPRRASALSSGHARCRDGGAGLGRGEVNGRDHAGLTVLLRAASSTHASARDFVLALVEHPAIDLYAQDAESGWNALHRALYFGNISIARLLLAKERGDLTNPAPHSVARVGQLIKTKDHEGNSPFDLYNSTIATRVSETTQELRRSDHGSDGSDSDDEVTQVGVSLSHDMNHSVQGGELYVFGSNKNVSLGLLDDDYKLPKRIPLQRPDGLLHRMFASSHPEGQALETPPSPPDVDGIPNLIRNRPIVIQEVVMSKLHSAVLTTDPVSNLYMCGVGRGGRLGLGHENTQFKFSPVQGPFTDRKIRHVALGQNHTMAVTSNGELWTCGLNADAQLGYALPPPARSDEEPMSLTPRQVFGALKKELVLGVAASAIHSVAHTGSSLYCWGRNAGQLAVIDSDSRSLDVQLTPRRVAASLLSASIEMVSAIDKATICLLSNFTVWVFTNYGYNVVKFPVPDVLSNHDLVASSFMNRRDRGWKEIRHITSGGETIAALTARGDLFTMQLSHKGDASPPAGSTTNPVKMKSAVTQPQCIWNSKKDGVTSVSVGEHGSVILCTESGAVWRRVKRVNGKDSGFRRSDVKKKDFKFERVPYITDCVNVRSSVFGAFAAVRRDRSIMCQDIAIAEQSLWADVGSLCCLRDLKASEPTDDVKASRKSWDAAIARERPGSVSHEILRSWDLGQDLAHCFVRHGALDVEMRTTTAPEVRIPVHGWILAARSCVLREALSASHRGPMDTTHSDTFLMETLDGKRVVTFVGVDLLTVLNVVLFAYQDAVIPVWRYTRDAPPCFRQVRSEVMKLATKLHMAQLEAAARLQTGVKRSLDADMKEAIADATFFEDGDIMVQLDGGDAMVHSQLVCQRCPFFEGMFQGRSQGQWLRQRRSESSAAELVRIDLKHMSLGTFRYVLRYLYADAGEDVFSDVAAPTIDDFSELVLDVMGAANELMLDRLSQVCQSVIGKFVTTRNISGLLNEISPCSVTEFKDAGLEYMAVQLECMLENHLLDCLDEDLLLELDQVVRKNQLARFPVARSGRAELLLHEKYPDLAADMDEERRRRVKDMAFRLTQKDDERRLSSSYKARVASLDEAMTVAQTAERSRPTATASRSEQPSPTLRCRRSQGDMIFSMDDEGVSGAPSPLSPKLGASNGRQDIDVENMPQLPEAWRRGGAGKAAAEAAAENLSPSSPLPPQPWAHGAEQASGGGGEAREAEAPARKASGPWAPPASTASRVDLRDIMSEASSKSALSPGLAAQATRSPTSGSRPPVKMSQKERKKHLQMQAQAEVAGQAGKPQQAPWEVATSGSRPRPWKAAAAAAAAATAPKTTLREAMSSETAAVEAAGRTKPGVASEARPHLAQRRTGSPDTRFPGQGRTSGSAAPASGHGSAASGSGQRKPLVPHSKSYMSPAPKVGPSPGASMADIIGQQKREQELAREAVAKRSLEEIQQEQAFQEWWDQESRRAQEDEARRRARLQDASGNDRGGGRGRARRGRAKGSGEANKGSSGEANRGSEAKGSEASGISGDGGEGPKRPSGAAPRQGKGVKGRGSKA